MPTALHFEDLLQALGFAGARISGLLIFAPFFGGMAVPARVKAVLVAALTLLLHPAYGAARVHLTAYQWGAAVLNEVLAGMLLGLTLQFLFDGVQIAGQVLGVQMGVSLVNIMDPQTQVDTSVLSILHQTVALLIFLQLDVHHWLLRGLARSFEYMPPASVAMNGSTVSELLRLAGGMWLCGVQIAAPVLLATLLTDITLGFIGKASPQLPVLFLGLSIKSLLGCAVLIAALPLWPKYLEKHFAGAIAAGERLLRLAR